MFGFRNVRRYNLIRDMLSTKIMWIYMGRKYLVRKTAYKTEKSHSNSNDVLQTFLQLHKLYNGDEPSGDWLDLNYQQNFNARQNNFQVVDTAKLKVGRNILCNRLKLLNGKIDLDWLLFSYEKYKLKSKSIFLSCWPERESAHCLTRLTCI